ncbi:MAG: PPC domain-containing DNA-binding protein [Halobacteria archaeon]|nr:PPC domain-containing DNA-binding protein [Halobacteria archaeon]
MKYTEVEGEREFLVRLENGRDWREQIEEVADEEGIDAAWFNGMGAVTDAELWFYDHDEKEYYPETFDDAFEVAGCVGNVTWLDGERFAHTHFVLTNDEYEAIGGHLNRATTFAGEVWIREFDTRVERAHDPEVTDLDLWSDESLEG